MFQVINIQTGGVVGTYTMQGEAQNIVNGLKALGLKVAVKIVK